MANTDKLTHVNDSGQARMVDVSAKPRVRRRARAEGFVQLTPGTIRLVRENALAKGDDRIRIEASGACTDKTGIEMEALTAVSVAALTVYDMCKAVDKQMRIEGVRLLSKTKEAL